MFETDAPWWPNLITCSIFNKQGWIMHLVLIIHLKGWMQNLSHRLEDVNDFGAGKCFQTWSRWPVMPLWSGPILTKLRWMMLLLIFKCSWQVGCWIRDLSFRCWRKLKLNEQITYLGTARLNLRYSNLHGWYK